MIVAVLAKSVQVRHLIRNGRPVPGGEIGGAPKRIRHDRGKDWLSERAQHAFEAMNIDSDASLGRHPWSHGKSERFNKIVQKHFCVSLPGYDPKESKDENGQGIHVDWDKILPEDEFFARLVAWKNHYNSSRPHKALGAGYPNDAWIDECHRPLREIDDEAIRACMLQAPRLHKCRRTVSTTAAESSSTPTCPRSAPPSSCGTCLTTTAAWTPRRRVHLQRRPHKDLTEQQRQRTYKRRGQAARKVRQTVKDVNGSRDAAVKSTPTDEPTGPTTPDGTPPTTTTNRSALLDLHADDDGDDT